MSMGGARHSLTAYTPQNLIPPDFALNDHISKKGLGIITAGIFLAGEMAGSGILALPAALKGTAGPIGLLLIIFFTINSAFSGTRLGLCWIMCEERYPHLRAQVRDPYPTIGEKAVGPWGRHVSTFMITLTLYGGGVVFLVLISQLLASLMVELFDIHISLCLWMVIITFFLTPITWMGTPKDFWPIAVGALLTTAAATYMIIAQGIIDSENFTTEREFSNPTPLGSFKAFSSIMFAFAGASTFPTIQADMKRRDKFHISAIMACAILFILYFPIAGIGYYSYGNDAEDNIVLSLSPGPMRYTIEILLLLHLISAFPIITNPPSQFFECLLNIEPHFNWKRCVFRTLVTFFLLFIAESIPSFGSILDFLGATSITALTFVFPPLFYMKLIDSSTNDKDWIQRRISIWERGYCWFLIIIGIIGGACATYTAVLNIVSDDFKMPCYLESLNVTAGDISH
ncbi:uncharacterized protein [Lepeophtheirus salmonis]|uniref:uncharacterized protein n=1 Tax=Lepeophtheirus salmonis TaxID=72036 RepID=UPI003AF3BA84